MRLIVTRPEPDDLRTARALMSLGHVAILSPMLDVRLRTGPLPGGVFQAVLVTSANAVRALTAHPDRAQLVKMPILAVGDQTALEAKRAGFGQARSAGGAIEDLAALVRTEMRPEAGPLLYAAGDVQANDLAGLLANDHFEVATAIVYETVPRATLSGVAVAALSASEVDGVLFYSRRTAAAFASALRAARLAPLAEGVTCFCLSAAIAEPLAAFSKGPILVAGKPDQISLFALIEGRRADAAPGPASPP